MRDRVSEELISAYIDGELTVDERELVERVLAESVEHRQLLAELQGIRRSFGELPQYQLGDDFHHRVLAAIQQVEAPRSPQQATPAPAAKRATSLWWRVGLGVAAVAATIILAVALRPGSNGWDMAWRSLVGSPPEIPGEKQQAAPFSPDSSWYDEQFVYYPAQSRTALTHCVVIDLVITPEGQANRAFHEAFRRAGVPVDPEMTLDPDLEQSLLGSRMLGNVRADQREVRDKVELFYVVCEADKATTIIEDFQSLTMSGGGEVVYCHMDVVFNTQELEMMYQLNHSSMSQFAGPESNKERRSLVHRLAVKVKLSSISIPKVARITAPQVSVGAMPATSHLAQLEQGPSELLFVVRNLREPAHQ